jgi:sortase A
VRRSGLTIRTKIGLSLGALAVVAAACGGGGSKAAPPTTVDDPAAGVTVVATTTVRTLPPTIATTTIPLAPVASAAPAPTAPATTLPTPVAPPAEDASEAVQLLGKIDIPKLKLDDDMYEGVALSTLDHGPGHWPGTALPGQPGNVVIAGHRVSHSKPFLHIDSLVPGDDVIFTVNGATYTYRVTSHEIVPPTAIGIVNQTADSTATLFACHPPGSVAERYVVHLKLAS